MSARRYRLSKNVGITTFLATNDDCSLKNKPKLQEQDNCSDK
ncbi:hypothetical protein [Bacillus toyonensis]|nr:hypothetical protein [Bacillus toyonensis]EJQ80927.1 hypothetical protein IGK_02272 [Bacillus toyonensis]